MSLSSSNVFLRSLRIFVCLCASLPVFVCLFVSLRVFVCLCVVSVSLRYLDRPSSVKSRKTISRQTGRIEISSFKFI